MQMWQLTWCEIGGEIVRNCTSLADGRGDRLGRNWRSTGADKSGQWGRFIGASPLLKDNKDKLLIPSQLKDPYGRSYLSWEWRESGSNIGIGVAGIRGQPLETGQLVQLVIVGGCSGCQDLTGWRPHVLMHRRVGKVLHVGRSTGDTIQWIPGGRVREKELLMDILVNNKIIKIIANKVPNNKLVWRQWFIPSRPFPSCFCRHMHSLPSIGRPLAFVSVHTNDIKSQLQASDNDRTVTDRT